jgi:hypothetical protein
MMAFLSPMDGDRSAKQCGCDPGAGWVCLSCQAATEEHMKVVALKRENGRLITKNYDLEQENHVLRQLVILFRGKVDCFLKSFQQTIDNVH